MKASRTAALWLIGIGILHTALFLWFGRGIFGAIAGDGFWNAVSPMKEREAVFWALVAGVFFFLLGQLALWVAKQGKTLPAFLGWEIVAITLVCGILIPVSGAWLFAVPGVLIVLGARKPDGGRRIISEASLGIGETRGRQSVPPCYRAELENHE